MLTRINLHSPGDINKSFEPYGIQRSADNRRIQRLVISAGRRTGKSIFLLSKMIREIYETPGIRVAYISPYPKMFIEYNLPEIYSYPISLGRGYIKIHRSMVFHDTFLAARANNIASFYIDEPGFINDQDLKSIQETGAKIIAAGTPPRYKNTMFEHWCHKDPTFVHMHYGYLSIPDVGDMQEVKPFYSRREFKREIEGIF